LEPDGIGLVSWCLVSVKLVRRDCLCQGTCVAIEAGCRKAARVSSRSVLRPLQMSRLAKVRSGYPSRQFDTWEQAEAYLDGDED
jgi:hypothetical protein